MKAAGRFFFFLALLTLGCGAEKQLAKSPAPQTANLTILHWNDFHSQNLPWKVSVKDTAAKRDSIYEVGGTATLLGYIKHYKQDRSEVALLNAGDDFQGTPISSITKGRSQIELMNIIHPDAVTLGNHEFDYGLASLEEKLALANYPIISANLFDQRKNKSFLPPHLVRTYGKVKVGVIGLMSPALGVLTMRENFAGLELIDHIRAVRKAIAELEREKVDLIVVLSHIGVDDDRALADSIAAIDVIVGGHSHTPLFKPVKQNRTVIVQAGSRGRWLGKLDLVVDLAGDSLLSYEGKLIETAVSKVAADSVAQSKVAELEAAVGAEVNEVIGTLETDWNRGYDEESNLGNWATDVMRETTNADIAFCNSGGIRKDLLKGEITVRDIWEIFPFNNTLVKISVDGRTLRQMLEWQAAGKGAHMQVSGLRYRFDSSKPLGERVIEATVNGEPISDTREYAIATNSYVSSHFAEFFGMEKESLKIESTGLIDHEAFIAAVRKQKRIASRVEGRVVEVGKLENSK